MTSLNRYKVYMLKALRTSEYEFSEKRLFRTPFVAIKVSNAIVHGSSSCCLIEWMITGNVISRMLS